MTQTIVPPGRRLAMLTAAGIALPWRPAFAWPDRAVRMIVPYPAGGTTDTFARMLTQGLQPQVGQPLVIENRGGASGSIGAAAAARATPDGHTLFFTITDTQAINPAIFRTLPYDPEADFVPISLIARVPFGLLVGPTLKGIADAPALFAEAKRAPGRFTFSTWGVGSTSHLASERVAKWAGLELTHVPFTGGAPARQAVAAGQVDFMCVPVGEGAQHTRDGACRFLAVLAPQRISGFPAVPTMTELGLPLSSGFWIAMYAPAKTPASVIAQINAAVGEALKHPAVVAAFATQYTAPEPSTPEQLAELQRSEREAWGAAARDANVRLD